MRYLYLIFWLIIIVLAVTFAALNAHQVSVNYYFGVTHLTLPALLLWVLVLGVVLGILVMLPGLCKARHQARKNHKKAKSAEQEVNNLRRMPISEEH
jgi:putative membrane protein